MDAYCMLLCPGIRHRFYSKCNKVERGIVKLEVRREKEKKNIVRELVLLVCVTVSGCKPTDQG